MLLMQMLMCSTVSPAPTVSMEAIHCDVILHHDMMQAEGQARGPQLVNFGTGIIRQLLLPANSALFSTITVAILE